MNLNSALRNRKVVAMIAVAFAVVTLAGCSKITYEEASASDHRVVEINNNFMGNREWAYIGPDGNQVPLTENCREHLFDNVCQTIPDGSVQFRYYVGKGGVINGENIVLDGVEMDAECLTEGLFTNEYVCAPVPED